MLMQMTITIMPNTAGTCHPAAPDVPPSPPARNPPCGAHRDLERRRETAEKVTAQVFLLKHGGEGGARTDECDYIAGEREGGGQEELHIGGATISGRGVDFFFFFRLRESSV